MPPVTATFANDGRRFTGDRGFIDGGDAFHDVTIAGYQVAGLDQNDIAWFQAGSRHRTWGRFTGHEELGHRIGLGLAKRGGLRLAAPFGDRFG